MSHELRARNKISSAAASCKLAGGLFGPKYAQRTAGGHVSTPLVPASLSRDLSLRVATRIFCYALLREYGEVRVASDIWASMICLFKNKASDVRQL